MTATQTCPVPQASDTHYQASPTVNGRDANGRFAKDNPDAPGNPVYRQQAEFRCAVLELIMPEGVMSLLRVMLAFLAATRCCGCCRPRCAPPLPTG